MLFGQAQTINSANYTFFRGLTQLQHLGNAKLCETFSGEFLRSYCLLAQFNAIIEGLQVLSLGQALELHWRDGSICPNVDEYMTMVDSKTGGFFRLVAQLMAVAAGWKIPSCLAELITVLGRYYQIRDDYQNLISDEVINSSNLLTKVMACLLTSHSTPALKVFVMTSTKESSLFLLFIC